MSIPSPSPKELAPVGGERLTERIGKCFARGALDQYVPSDGTPFKQIPTIMFEIHNIKSMIMFESHDIMFGSHNTKVNHTIHANPSSITKITSTTNVTNITDITNITNITDATNNASNTIIANI
jgi:hypothetical protein